MMDGFQKAVLVVEDEADLRELFSLMLEGERIEVLQAGDGTEALRLLEQRGASIDLIVTDMNLPGADGPKVMARAREIAPGAKILVMSGYGGTDMLSAVQGADGFMTKPFNPTQALATVKQLLELP
jgi:CheY-like chemotaxis protein